MVPSDSPYMVSYWYVYSNLMSISHRLAVIVTQFFFISLVISRNLRKLKQHRMTSKWHWTLQGQRYPPPPYVKLLTTSPKFHSVLLFWFPIHSMWNFPYGSYCANRCAGYPNEEITAKIHACINLRQPLPKILFIWMHSINSKKEEDTKGSTNYIGHTIATRKGSPAGTQCHT